MELNVSMRKNFIWMKIGTLGVATLAGFVD
jgi:hypothetical protein